MGWQEVKEQLRAAVFRLQSLALPWGFIVAKRGGERRVQDTVCFLEEITTQTTVCVVVPPPGGGNSQKWGLGTSRG